MSGLPHIDQVKTHFVSGEPGTTGREPFEDSISSGKFLPDHLMGDTNSAPHIPAGTHVGGAPIGAGIDSHGAHSSTHGTHDQHGEKKGLVEKVKEVLPPNHDNNSSSTHGTHSTHDTTHGEKKPITEKIKEALPIGGNKDHSSSTHSSSTHNNNNHGLATGAGVGAVGAGAYGASHHGTTDTNASYNRDIVDKINDALPGTPSKTPQAYQAGDVSTGVTGTAYGAGKHAGAGEGVGHSGVGHSGVGSSGVGHSGIGHSGEGIHPGVGGVVSGGHGVAGTAHDSRMVDRAPESLDHKNEPSKGGLSGVLGTSDKDFLARDRKGDGAYADTDGVFEQNTTGPKGNPALTGREGNPAHNPVAQKHGHADTTSTTSTGEKKGLLQKIKDVL